MAKFSLGMLCATAGVAEQMRQDRDFHAFVWQCLSRYREGDWGDMTSSDKRANDDAVACGDARILASYKGRAIPRRTSGSSPRQTAVRQPCSSRTSIKEASICKTN